MVRTLEFWYTITKIMKQELKLQVIKFVTKTESFFQVFVVLDKTWKILLRILQITQLFFKSLGFLKIN